MRKFIEYDYLISCPSDVKDELDIIREIVEKHNISIGEDYGYSIRIKHWSTDTYPELGDHPQSIINEQLVDACDGVIAIFWTRFGTPTTRYNSGTEEEIERLLQQQRPVLLYFSDQSIRPSVFRENMEQYNRVLKFREKYKDKGIYYTYNSLNEFKIIFERHFQLHCKRYNIKLDNVISNNIKPDSVKSDNNVLVISNRYEHLASRLIDFMYREDYVKIRSIFEDSISQEISKNFKRLLTEIPNYDRVNIQIFLESVYSLSCDNEMSREQCCFYMGCLKTKRTQLFLIEQLNKEKSYLVLRGIYFALMSLTDDDVYNVQYLELIKNNPIAASINAGYHQIHYGDKYHCEGYEFDLYQKSTNALTALNSHINSNDYVKIKALDLFTYRYILYYTFFIDMEKCEIPNLDNLEGSDIQLNQFEEFNKFIKSIKKVKQKYYYVGTGLIKRLPSPEWMVKKLQEYKSLVYIDNDFQPVAHNNCIETYKQQFVLDEEKFDNLIAILHEYEEFRKDDLNVCDIGCSYGAFLHCWSKYYKGQTMGIDISEGAAKVSQSLFANNYNIVEENAYKTLSPLSDKVDVITCFDFIEHVFNLEYFLFMLFETIKKNALAVFYLPIYEESCMNLDVLSNHKFFTDSHIYYFTQEGFKQFVSRVSGFELLYERPIGQKYLFIYRKK